MANEKEKLLSSLVENLYSGNEFLTESRDDTGEVIDGVLVRMPQAGAPPEVRRNVAKGTSIAPVYREDGTLTYELTPYRTVTEPIPNIDKKVLSYDKTKSLMLNHTAAMRDLLALDALGAWSPSSDRILFTSGADSGRFALPVYEDILALRTGLSKDKVPNDGRRVLLVSSDMASYLMNIDEFIRVGDFGGNEVVVSGQIGKLLGFKVIERDVTRTYRGDKVIRPVGAVADVDDRQSILAWHPDMVCRAVGEMDWFEQKDEPQSQSDIYSAYIRFGASKTRLDNKGVWALLQGSAY